MFSLVKNKNIKRQFKKWLVTTSSQWGNGTTLYLGILIPLNFAKNYLLEDISPNTDGATDGANIW